MGISFFNFKDEEGAVAAAIGDDLRRLDPVGDSFKLASMHGLSYSGDDAVPISLAFRADLRRGPI